VILALRALRTDSLSTSILIHAGFNLTTTLLVVLAPGNLS
jgi:membrane protease YdiL (CAAX protease family)